MNKKRKNRRNYMKSLSQKNSVDAENRKLKKRKQGRNSEKKNAENKLDK